MNTRPLPKDRWKELLAKEAARKQAAEKAAAEATGAECQDGVKAKAEATVPAVAARWKSVLILFHRYRYWSLAASLFVLAVSLAAHFGPDDRPQRVSVSGQVLIDGQPLTWGTIMFVPEKLRPSVGSLDANGRFTLSCFDGGDGAVLGTHRLEVTANKVAGEEDPPWLVPSKYADYQTSGLAVTITGRTDSLVIHLSTEGAPPTAQAKEGSPALPPDRE